MDNDMAMLDAIKKRTSTLGEQKPLTDTLSPVAAGMQPTAPMAQNGLVFLQKQAKPKTSGYSF